MWVHSVIFCLLLGPEMFRSLLGYLVFLAFRSLPVTFPPFLRWYRSDVQPLHLSPTPALPVAPCPHVSSSSVPSTLLSDFLCSTDSFLCIDLSFCFSSVVLDLTWSRLSSFFGSDYHLILMCEVHCSPLPSGSSHWPLKTLYLSSFASLDAALGFFNDLILDAANNFILHVSSLGKLRLPCWTPKCSAVTQTKKCTYRHWLLSLS